LPITNSFVSSVAEAQRAENERGFTTWSYVGTGGGSGADKGYAGISQSRGNSHQHEQDYIMLYEPNITNHKLVTESPILQKLMRP
jgi:hypothetical protein